MGKILCRVLMVAVLIAAVVNVSTVFRTSPAFNSDERMESVVGGWRVPNTASHYDKAEYRLELAYGYLNELGLTYDPETGQTGFIDDAELKARMLKAQEHIAEVIRLDPANASAWAYQAQAQNGLNEFDNMRDSLNHSWSLAPHNLQLAPLRLRLAIILDQHAKNMSPTVTPLTTEEIAAIRRDGMVLQKNAPRYLARLMERSDILQTLLDGLEATGPTG